VSGSGPHLPDKPKDQETGVKNASQNVSLDDLGVFALMAKAFVLQPVGRSVRTPRTHAGRYREAGNAAAARIARAHRALVLEARTGALEAHLSEAKDVYDLEARIRSRAWRPLSLH
jgi:hypothetical protein